MFGAVLLRLPVHAGGALVIHLHAIDADVALPCFRIARKNQRPGDETPRILRPALQDGKFKQREIFAANDFLARAGLHGLRKKRTEFGELRQHFDFVEQALRRLHVEKTADARRHFVNVRDFEREIHAALAAQHVDEQRNARALRFFKQQGRAAGARHAIGDLRDFEDRIDFSGDAPQFALFFQLGNEFAQIPVRQNILPIRPAATAGGLRQTQRDTLA